MEPHDHDIILKNTIYLNDSHLEQHEYEKWEGHHLQMNKKEKRCFKI